MNGSTLVSFRAIPQLGAWQNRIHWQKLTEPPLIENPAAFHLLPWALKRFAKKTRHGRSTTAIGM